MPLRLRFSLVISALVVAVVAGTSGIFYISERDLLWRQVQNQQEELAKSLAQVVHESFMSQDDLMLINYTVSLPARNPLLSFAYVSDAQRYLAHSRKELSGAALAQWAPPTDDIRLFKLPVTTKDRPPAEAVVGFSQGAMARWTAKALMKTQARILWASAIMVGVGLIASVILAATLTRPISRLAQAAGALGQGRLDTRVEAASASSRDELSRLGLEFNAMAAKLQELDEMKRDFVSAVTHELKSPLAAIDSYLALMIHESKKPRDLGRWIEDISSIRNHTARLMRFVTDLLDVAKLERGSFPMRPVPTSIKSLAEDAAGFMAPLARKNQVALEVRVQASVPQVQADPERVRQVLVNLLSNALKFTPAGGRVGLELLPGAQHLTCVVSDTGVGIAPEDCSRIFSKFEQVASARAQARGPKGTGLGLSICKAIVEGHGGRIWVESAPGSGSRFCFTLPYGGAS